MDMVRVLAVDDEKIILENIREYLSDYKIEIESNPEKAIEHVSKEFYDIIIADYKMPGKNGLDLLMEAKKHNAYRYGILVTAYADIPLLKEFLNHGLIKQFLEKPIRLPALQAVIDEAIGWCREDAARERKLAALQELCNEKKAPIIGAATTLRNVIKDIERIGQSDEPILITGETGTGKEVIAKEVHRKSSRHENAFIKINCAALPDSLIESELFGYSKGAFSGAEKEKPGKIEYAHGGTLFLDEIAELKPELQTKLLQVIQDKEVERLGSTKAKKVDFRLICATNQDIHKLIGRGSFRQDLFFRINTFHIHLPPLRERKEDIVEFIHYFLTRISEEIGRKPVSIDPSAYSVLEKYLWPGNVRELENVLKRALILLDTHEELLSASSFSQFFPEQELLNGKCRKEQHSYDSLIDLLAEKMNHQSIPLKMIEEDLVKQVLKKHELNVRRAEECSGIQKDKLYKTLKKLQSEN
jgi:DNA-binding NtrC family response regulator